MFAMSLFLLAQVPAVDPSTVPLESVINLLIGALEAGSRWYVLVPFALWAVIAGVRKYAAGLAPWFASKAGGLFLALSLNLLAAFIDVAASSPAWSAALVLGTLLKGLVAAFVSMGFQSGQKSMREAAAGQ